MPEGFHPAPPDATYGVRREDIPADVRDYADNLMLQLDEIVAQYGIKDFRAARAIPDAERHERLEAVMDLKDIERYVELIQKYRTALTIKTIPTGDRDWRNAEARPFAYDREKARELGFAELRVEAYPAAQEIFDAVYNRDPRFVSVGVTGSVSPKEEAVRAFWKTHCWADLPDVPQHSMEFFRAVAEHRLSDTIDGDDRATVGRPSRPHVPRFGTPGFVLSMDWKEFNPAHSPATVATDSAVRAAAVSPGTRALFQRLFGQEDVTNISRDTVNATLYTDHENRVQSPGAAAVIRDLIGPIRDPAAFELRLIRYDEYARAAAKWGFGGKALTTHFDGYRVWHGDRVRDGLLGGRRYKGGSADVDTNHREFQNDTLAVRLVLSRKQPCSVPLVSR